MLSLSPGRFSRWVKPEALVIARHSFTYVFSTAVNMGLPFLTLPIFARLLKPSDFGPVVMLQSIVTLLSTLLIFGLRSIVLREYVGASRAVAKAYMSGSLLISAGATAFVIALILLLQRPLISLTTLPLPWLVLGCVTAAATVIIQYYLTTLQASGRAQRYSMMQNGVTAGIIACSLVLVIFVSRDWAGRAGGLVAGSLLGGAVALWFLRKEVGRTSKAMLSELLLLSLATVPHSLANGLIGLADRLFLANRYDAKVLGLYGVATQLCLIPFALGTALNTAMSPWWMRKLHNTKSMTEWRKLQRFSFMIGIALAILTAVYYLILLAIFPHLFRPAYHDALTFFLPLLIGSYFNAAYFQFCPPIFFYKRGKVLSVIGVINLAFTITAMFVFSNYWGPFGVAVALMLSRAILLFGTMTAAEIMVRAELRSDGRHAVTG